jgi:uncharacterized protein YjiS (DUF1127 family)
MSRSATFALSAAATSPASRRGAFRPLANLFKAMRRERVRRQLDALNDHLRRDVGLLPRDGLPRWTDPVDPRGRM